MTKSIFEYKDEQDWYLASFGSYNHLTCFGGDEAYEQFVDFFQALTNVLAVSGFQLHIAKHSSDLRLVSFILDCLKEVEMQPDYGSISDRSRDSFEWGSFG